MDSVWHSTLQAALTRRQAEQAYRCRSVHDAADRLPYLASGVRHYLNFATNDYLGFNRHPAVVAAWQHGVARYGAGSGASGHVTGYSDVHQQLEQALAGWLGYPRALLFVSGYAANQALIHALADEGCSLLMDKLCHASMQEAAASTPARLRRFAHLRHDVLAEQLAAHSAGRLLVATEGVFSMDGDSPDLYALRQLCDRHGAWLLLDDTHGFGINGPQGRGTAAAAGVRADVLVVTFGKAAGVAGAAVLCDEIVAEYLLQFARHLIYSTAMPAAQACAIHEAVRQLAGADEQRARLREHIAYFRQQAAGWDNGLRLLASASPIQPVVCGSNQRLLQAAGALQAQGLWVGAIRPPTVPAGQARLRITLSAAHEREHIDQLLNALGEA